MPEKPTYDELERQNRELKKQKQFLEDSYRSVIDNSMDAIFGTKPDGKIMFANKAACELFQMSEQEIISGGRDSILDLNDPRLKPALEERAKKGQYYGELNFKKKDGSVFPGELSSKIYQNNNQIFLTSTIVRDISDRKRAEDKMKSSEQKFRWVAETIDDVFWMSTYGVGKMIYINPAYEKIWQQTRASLYATPRSFLDSIHPEDIDEYLRVLDQYHKSGTSYEHEYRIVNRDGRVRWIHEKGYPVSESSDSEPLMVGVCHDITARKELMGLLKESEHRFRISLENMLDCFGIYSAIRDDNGIIQDFKIEYVNRSACHQTELTSEEQIGQRLCELFPDHRETGLFEAYCQVVETGKPLVKKSFIYESDFSENYPKSIFDIQVVKIDDGFAAAWRDVTEKEQLKQESKHHLEQALRADRLAALGEVVAGVAHEINNPNSFITFNLPILEDIWGFFKPIIAEYAKLNPEAGLGHIKVLELSKDLDDILIALKKGSERICQVVGKLKRFAMPEETQAPQTVNVNQVIEETLSMFQTKLNIQANPVEIRLNRNIPVILGYPVKMEQVFTNLLLNAAQSIAGNQHGRIVIKTRYAKDMGAVCVDIEDNGKGLKKDEIRQIFNPFYTTRRTEGGTGLGLSISHTIIKEHGGVIGVFSKPKQGSCFSIFFPIDPKGLLKPQKNILIIDDNTIVLEMLESDFFNLEHHHIHAMSDPDKALLYIENHPEIDLVISDIMMPGVNGWHLFREIAQRYSYMPVILYSGFPEALENPFDDIEPAGLLKKPIYQDKLVETIQQVIRVKL